MARARAPSSGPRTTTRSRTGARWALGLWALVALLPGGRALGAADGDLPDALPWRAGGRIGFTVDAASFPDSSGYTLDVYVRIPPATLASLARDSLGTSEIELAVRLRGAYGGREQNRSQAFRFGAQDTIGEFGKVVLVRFPTRPGIQRLEVRLVDSKSHKRGLAYIGREAREAATVRGDFQVPKPQMARDLSDIEFVWTEGGATGLAAFQRGERPVLPNPERLYGLFADELRAWFVARSGPGDERPWHWVARVLDPKDQVVAEQESTAAADRWLKGMLKLDLSTLPASGYDLEVKAWQEGDPGALIRRAHFSVAWRAESWLRNPRDVEDDVHFLLEPDAEERFALLDPGEQERYLDDFWHRRDPVPETAENEARTVFERRVEHANQNYGRFGLGKGMFSDMGRVYIRYGEPSEVLHQVIPAGDETLAQVLQQIAVREDRPLGEVAQKGLGGDIRPFEVWIYEGEIPLPPDADPSVTVKFHRRRLLFLFVDEQGLGQYRLRYSTE